MLFEIQGDLRAAAADREELDARPLVKGRGPDPFVDLIEVPFVEIFAVVAHRITPFLR